MVIKKVRTEKLVIPPGATVMVHPTRKDVNGEPVLNVVHRKDMVNEYARGGWVVAAIEAPAPPEVKQVDKPESEPEPQDKEAEKETKPAPRRGRKAKAKTQ